MPRLTKRFIDSLSPDPTGRDVFAWDSDLRGFGFRLKPATERRPRGTGSWIIQYRNADGRSRRYTVAQSGALTAEEARKRARQLLSEVANRSDPAEAKKAAAAEWTVAQMVDAFLAAKDVELRPSTRDIYRSAFERHVKPLLGHRRIGGLRAGDIHAMRSRIAAGDTAADVKTRPRGRALVRGGSGIANRAVAYLSSAFAWAMRQAPPACAANPCHGVAPLDRKDEKPEWEELTPRQLAALGEALADAEASGINRMAVAAIRVLAFTGARRNEILTLRWDQVNLERRRLELPRSKTGKKNVLLTAPAAQVLAGIRREPGCAHVFPSTRHSGAKGERAHLTDLEKPWRAIRSKATVKLWAADADDAIAQVVADLRRHLEREPKEAECRDEAGRRGVSLPAGLSKTRLHDLRHNFASSAVNSGESLYLTSKMLGHATTRMTEAYAHADVDPVQAAADRTARLVERALTPASQDRGSVVHLPLVRPA